MMKMKHTCSFNEGTSYSLQESHKHTKPKKGNPTGFFQSLLIFKINSYSLVKMTSDPNMTVQIAIMNSPITIAFFRPILYRLFPMTGDAAKAATSKLLNL